MDSKTKAVACVVPFLIAGYVGFMMAMPAVQAWQEKSSALDEKKKEEQGLKDKLVSKSKIQREKNALEVEINALRRSVPKSPELELLNIDVEKMALDSDLDVISFKEPDAEALKKMEEKMEAPSLQRGKDALAEKAKAAMAPLTNAAAGGTDKKEMRAEVEPDAGLSKVTMQVKLTGDYLGLLEFVKKLETYQKVISINHLEFHIPKKVEGKDKAKGTELPDYAAPKEDDVQGDPKQLQISFVLTSYYLP